MRLAAGVSQKGAPPPRALAADLPDFGPGPRQVERWATSRWGLAHGLTRSFKLMGARRSPDLRSQIRSSQRVPAPEPEPIQYWHFNELELKGRFAARYTRDPHHISASCVVVHASRGVLSCQRAASQRRLPSLSNGVGRLFGENPATNYVRERSAPHGPNLSRLRPWPAATHREIRPAPPA